MSVCRRKKSPMMASLKHYIQVFPLFLLVVLSPCLLSGTLIGADDPTVVSPNSKRTEGRVTLENFGKNGRIKYQLAFSEVVDTTTMRSKVSIGHVSYEPRVYYSRDGNMLMVDRKDGCRKLSRLDHMLVPELDWFIKQSYTNEELEQEIPVNKRHHIGPTGLAFLFHRGIIALERQELHRNVECRVYSATHETTKAKDIVYEVFIPKESLYESNLVQIFAFRHTAKHIVSDSHDEVSAIMTVDYFYTENINETDPHQMELLERDLNLPFGVGCTEFVAPTQPMVSASQSFIMTYSQNSLQSVISLAYDHRSNYLRKEKVGVSVGVWDLNEDLFYHVDQSSDGKEDERGAEVTLEECSVISLESGESRQQSSIDDSILRPYSQSGSSLNVLDFLGATSIHYMGQATVRDMPCLVYETVLSAPPKVFNLDLRADLSPKSSSIDYIVQYYIFKTTEMKLDQPGRRIGQDQREDGTYGRSSVPLIGDQFWPARIILIKRDKKWGSTEVQDRLEIVDFHWGLFGLTKKPSELFMMPECFNDEQEQVSINFELLFAKNLWDEEQKLLRHNKYKLEKDLVDDLFHSFGMSLMHLTEFELALRRRSVMVSLVISDRIEDKRLTYFGEGELPEDNAHASTRMLVQLLDQSNHGGESDCLMKVIHMSGVSMVVYCPRNAEGPTCTAIFGESEPVIKRPASADSQSGNENPLTELTACRVYRLEPRAPPKSGTKELDKIRQTLKNHLFSFEVTDTQRSPESPSKPVKWDGVIIDFDVAHQLQLLTINNYKYALDAKQDDGGANGDPVGEKPSMQTGSVRAFDTISYNNMGDCLKMCNLDPSCRSFSYCDDNDLVNGKCILASLDLRANYVEEQLVSTNMVRDKWQLVVRDFEMAKEAGGQQTKAGEYKLELKSACNIYERDSLSMFIETDELVRIEESLQNQYMKATSAFDCAHSIVALEASQSNYYSGMFAFCPSTGSCLLDERLFGSIESASSSSNKTDEESPDRPREVLCQVFRKRYQTYFHVSPFVLKRVPHDDKDVETRLVNQMDLQFNTVEECAHACWNSFGHACISFDYCLLQSCIINLINGNATGSMAAKDLLAKLDYEPRTGCLHYERDLALDELRRANLIGHHKALDLIQSEDDEPSGRARTASGAGFWSNVPYYVAVAVLFVVGLVVGHKFDQRLLISSPGPQQTHQSEHGGGGGGFSSGLDIIRRFSSLARFGTDRRGSTSSRSNFHIDDDIYEDTGAIQMEEIGLRNDSGADELTSTARDQTDSSTNVGPSGSPSSSNKYQSTESKSNARQENAFPNRIDVPDILL